jgi:hypothetical protein
LNPEPESSDQLTGVCDGKIPSGPDEVARQRNGAFLLPVAMAPFLPYLQRSKTFRVESNSYNEPTKIAARFQSLRNGGVLALTENRRSGAQRGASENNFGQRFSVSTPCFNLAPWTALPQPSFFLGYEFKRTI